jgi:hypothetical protein
VLILNSIQEVYNDLEQILPDLNIEHQMSLKIIIMGIPNATISVELIATVIAHLLARKSRQISLNREQNTREITNLMKIEEFIAKNKVEWMSNGKFLRI